MADGRGLATTCDSALAAKIRAKVKAEGEREAAWWSEELEAVHAIEDPAERARARGELEAERLRRREQGEYLASRDALLRYHLVKVLAAHGWDKKYKPVPAGAASVPGRRTGVPMRSGRTGDRKGRLACNLPADLWEQVRRAAYWVSEPHVRQLQKWHARFGDGPGAAGRSGRGSYTSAHPLKEDMDRRRELRAQVITTGDILRMAAESATS